MEFKGTKKNWLLNDTDNDIFGGSDNYTQISAGDGIYNHNDNIQSGFTLTGFISKENALLISKAPEMLNMLIKMKEALLELSNLQDGWDEDYEQLEQLILEATEI